MATHPADCQVAFANCHWAMQSMAGTTGLEPAASAVTVPHLLVTN
jgi:hypothetical protein